MCACAKIFYVLFLTDWLLLVYLLIQRIKRPANSEKKKKLPPINHIFVYVTTIHHGCRDVEPAETVSCLTAAWPSCWWSGCVTLDRPLWNYMLTHLYSSSSISFSFLTRFNYSFHPLHPPFTARARTEDDAQVIFLANPASRICTPSLVPYIFSF